VKTTAGVLVAGAWLAAAVPAGAQVTGPSRAQAEQRQQRYQITIMERVLEGAVEHGAAMTRDRLQTWLPADMLLNEGAQVRGFRLDGYGVFFDVQVPTLTGTIPWIFRTLDQNELGLDSALKALRQHVDQAGDANLQQALKRIELQVAPVSIPGGAAPTGRASSVATLASSSQAVAQPSSPPVDPILDDPEEAYRLEISDALMNAMLEHSRGLDIGETDWLHIAARRDDGRSRLGMMDPDARTVTIRVRGADLRAFLAGQISREEARQRMEVRVF
jgi:hypothetical protein